MHKTHQFTYIKIIVFVHNNYRFIYIVIMVVVCCCCWWVFFYHYRFALFHYRYLFSELINDNKSNNNKDNQIDHDHNKTLASYS